MARALAEGGEGVRAHRRRARHEQAHPADQLAIEPRVGHQPAVIGRDAGEDRCPRQLGEHRLGLEFRQQDHRGAASERRRRGAEQAIGHRIGVQQHVAGMDTPAGRQGARVPDHRSAGEERALRLAGRSGGVDHRVGRIRGRGRELATGLDRRAAFRERSAPVGCQRENAFRARRIDGGAAAGIADDSSWTGVADDVLNLGIGQPDMDRKIDRAEPAGRQIEQDAFRRFLQDARNKASRADVRSGQQSRVACGDVIDLAEPDAAPVEGFHEDAVGFAGGIEQGREDIRIGGHGYGIHGCALLLPLNGP